MIACILTWYQSRTSSESSFLVHYVIASSILCLLCALFQIKKNFSLHFLLIHAQFSFSSVLIFFAILSKLNSELKVSVQFSFSPVLIFFAILSKLNSELRVSVIDFHLDLDLIIENSILNSCNRTLGFL